ncbi:phosphotransferase family enzyme [Brevibacterium sanguinis]|uniref:Phosphotransferase family enzyme n=2 Tax=Brevibacterium TaxID=1696 RepID=A0A366IL44_9MICO|nr:MULTISPECIES: phosphotransferase [Brevibacterium]RBP65674.1 phosphotransferase family enzyme [Brevibacterium sanguinis]RBP72308.1 phosphotransferase family enzyme [Brevibacterium celere]
MSVDAGRRVSAYAGLPFIDEITTAAGLSEWIGTAVRPYRIRVKPGHGALLAWRRESDQGIAGDWGWAAIVTDPAKLSNIRRRADRRGTPVTVHATSGGHDGPAVLLSGELPGDPKLGKAIVRAGSGYSTSAEVLRYNPGRRLLLHSGTEVVRISVRGGSHVVAASRQWREWGLPTLPVESIGGHGTSVRSPWWGRGDLADAPDPAVAAAVGEAVAHLHSRAPAQALGRESRRRDLETELRSAGSRLLALTPELGADIRTIVGALATRLSAESAEAEPVPIHGDLSPDQVLVDGDEFRIIDLDRVGIGPVGIDIGTWAAACRLSGHDAMERAFLDGCARRGGVAVDVEAWCARALVVAAMEPFRRCAPDWRSRTRAIVDLAKEALSR